MADIYPRRVWPALAGAEAGYYLAPAHGAFLASLFDYYVHLACIRHLGRPEVDKVWDFDFDPLVTTPVGVAQDIRARIYAPPHAVHLVVGVQYQASPYGTSAPDLVALGAPPVMRITTTLLVNATGVALDSPGMRWDYGDGTLPPTVRVADQDWIEGAINAGTATYPPRWVFSGVAFNDSPGAGVTRPRPLNVGSGAPALVRLRLQTTNARVLRVKAWWLPEQVVSV